jgi:phosphate:Na+ symporter
MSATIDWLDLALGMLAGLGLFLYGVDVLATALREAQGSRFEALLRRSATNRFAALGTGTVATVALDSSSVVIILLIASVDAGLVPFAHALPAVLGANIGTTFSSQVFAWNVDQWSPLLIVAGLVGRATLPERWQGYARAVIGLGLVLFGLHTIGDAAEPLEKAPAILDWLKRLENPVMGVLAGAAATVAIQSSSAMMGIVITLAGGGLITLPAGVAIMLGAEIGTCADTLVATVGRSRAAFRAGLFHLGFNIVSVAVGVMLIDLLIRAAAMVGGDTGQRIATAHILFNVAGALAALPLVRSAAALLERLVPATEPSNDAEPSRNGNPAVTDPE